MKKKILEAIKTVLIVLLSLLVVILSAMALPRQDLANRPVASRILRPFAGMLGVAEAELTYTAPPVQRVITPAAQPIAITVRTADGRKTVQQDMQELDSAYEQLGSLLARGLDSAKEPRQIRQEQVMDALRETSVAYRFPCRIPADVLCAWLNVQPPVSHEANWYILHVQGEAVELLLLGESAMALDTELSARTVEESLADFSPDGSFFAFEDDTGRFDRVDPFSLVAGAGTVYTGSWQNPCEARWIAAVASGLGFNPYGGSRFVSSDGTTSFTDKAYALRVTGTGDLTLEILQAEPTFQSNSDSDADRIEAARRAVSQLAGDTAGDARLLFSGLEKTGSGAVCSFDYYLSGIRVSDGTEAAARVIFEGRQIRKLLMRVRTCQLTDEIPTLLPPAQAASIAEDLQELSLIYAEKSEGQLLLNWKKGEQP